MPALLLDGLDGVAWAEPHHVRVRSYALFDHLDRTPYGGRGFLRQYPGDHWLLLSSAQHFVAAAVLPPAEDGIFRPHSGIHVSNRYNMLCCCSLQVPLPSTKRLTSGNATREPCHIVAV